MKRHLGATVWYPESNMIWCTYVRMCRHFSGIRETTRDMKRDVLVYLTVAVFCIEGISFDLPY
jgi:hypothetical protein